MPNLASLPRGTFLRDTAMLPIWVWVADIPAEPAVNSYREIMKTTLTIFLFALLLCGCRATGHIKAGDPSKISVGMSKEEVLRALKQPEHVSADGNREVMTFILERPWWQDRPFAVWLVDGKVQKFQVIETGPAHQVIDLNYNANIKEEIIHERPK